MRTRTHATTRKTLRRIARACGLRPRPATEAGPLRGARLLSFLLRELAVWALFYGSYLLVRSLVIGSQEQATANARSLVDLERWLGLAHEARIQDLAAPLTGALSAYYTLGFGPLIAVVLVALGLRRPAVYRRLRTLLLVSVGIASLVHAMLPTAPPRLVDGLGIADTVGLSGHDDGAFLGIAFNPYAAMPSMHVGWSLLVGVVMWRLAAGALLRLLALAHPALMTLTVVATGNHYLLDAAAGAAVVGAAALLVAARPTPTDWVASARGLVRGGPLARLHPTGRE